MYGGGGNKRGGGGGGGGGSSFNHHRNNNNHRNQTPPLHRPSSSTRRLPTRTSTTSPATSSAAEERMRMEWGRELSFGMIVRLTPDLVGEIQRAEEHGGARIRFDVNGNNTTGNGAETLVFVYYDRLNPQTPPLNRPFSSTRHISNPAQSPATSSSAVEKMRMEWGRELSFGMIVRLTPDLVGEIQRAEERGGARIKFDVIGNNTTGNVIDVGGKNFRFTWSHETGDLCDIYEERKSGEDGDGLLVERGSAWRKLNVQRVLDESTKNHVKKRSEEAERQQRSRKSIILDSPSMKNQMKAVAASESNSWKKPFQTKKEPEFKKRKIDTTPVAYGGPAKSIYKSGFPLATTKTSRASISPSPNQHSAAPASPLFTANTAKGHMSAEDLISDQPMMRENVIASEREKFNKTTSSVVQDKPGRKRSIVDKSMDLQSMLITLLKQNPKGMSLKALEKAVGDSVPNLGKKIEPIIRKIATFKAPGRYVLNPGVELGSLKKTLSESGSSPDDNRLQTPFIEERHEDRLTSTPNFAQKTSAMELVKQPFLNLNDEDIQHHSPDPYGEKNIPENNEGPARSSSNNGSDSESQSSDSGSERSKSKSPVKSGSASSSESESESDNDVSSNSKQGPDEDVDIMTSDDEESKQKTQVDEPKFSVSPIPFRDLDTGPTQNGFEEKQDEIAEIEQDLPDDVHQTVVDYGRERENAGYMFKEREIVANDVSKRKSKSKSKRGSDSKPPHEKSGHSKRSKHGNLPQLMVPILPESPQTMSVNRVVEEGFEGRSSQVTHKAFTDGNVDYGFQKCDNEGLSGKSSMDFGTNSSGRNNQSHERLPIQKDRVISNNKDDTRNNNEKMRNPKENHFSERNPVGIVRGKMLQRELSDLELGEFREPSSGEKVGEKRLERKNSFKATENRPSSLDYWNQDLNKGRPTFRPNFEGPPKRTPDNQIEDIVKPPNRVSQSQSKVLLNSRKTENTSGKIRHNEAGDNHENGVVRVGDVRTDVSITVSKQKDLERGPVSHPHGENNTRKINSLPGSSEVHKGASLTESSEGVVKRRESSSDENSCSFSKYEKEEPECKGPIKDFPQYKEYVLEYQEKYDSYSLLNKALESYRSEFYKLGKDLESAKGRDQDKYYQILGRLQESYRQCGSRHKRLKKIFIVLHEELKHLKQAIKDYAASYAGE